MISKKYFRLKKNGEQSCECYCKTPELIENYEKAINDKNNVWEVHHRKEEFYSRKELIELGLYYDRPAEELIFLTHKEHQSLHKKGEKNPAKREDVRKKISESHKGKKFSEEAKQKMSEAKKGKHWRLENGKRIYY